MRGYDDDEVKILALQCRKSATDRPRKTHPARSRSLPLSHGHLNLVSASLAPVNDGDGDGEQLSSPVNGQAMSDIADLTAKTYEIARLIPHGQVTTYGGSPTRRLGEADVQATLQSWQGTRGTLDMWATPSKPFRVARTSLGRSAACPHAYMWLIFSE